MLLVYPKYNRMWVKDINSDHVIMEKGEINEKGIPRNVVNNKDELVTMISNID